MKKIREIIDAILFFFSQLIDEWERVAIENHQWRMQMIEKHGFDPCLFDNSNHYHDFP